MKRSFLPKIVVSVSIFLSLALLSRSVEAQAVRFVRDPVSGRVIKSEIVQAQAAKAKVNAAAQPSVAPSGRPTSTPVPMYEADKFWRANGKEFGFARASSDLTAFRTERDHLGMTHVRYRQRYRGLPVFGADAIVHLGSDGKIQTVNGQLAGWVRPRGALNASAASRKRAIKVALTQFKEEFGVTGTADAAVSKTIIAPGLIHNTGDRSSYLTWVVSVSAPRTAAISTRYFVDAVNGVVRFREERERQLTRKIYDCTANPASSACWSSLVNPDTGYHHGRREGEESWGPNPIFNAYDVDIGYDVLGAAHHYLMAAYGRDGANGRGGLGSGVSGGQPYDITAGNFYQDQFWGESCTTARYSADKGTLGICHAVAVPDVIAHEYAHGVTASVRQMTYYGQSGALDESFSDVFGEIFEKSYLGTTDWMNAGRPVPGTAIPLHRNIKDPADPTGEGPNPDRFYSPYVYCGGVGDNGGVHWNSTILSYAAYLMSEGTPQGRAFNGCTIRPIGMDKMEQVMYRANTVYYTSNPNFYEAYLDWNQACRDLIGSNGITASDCMQVERALQAVELDQPGACSKTTRKAPACQDVCQDSDAGLDPFARGAVTDVFTGNTAVDVCVLMNNSVAENYCDGDKLSVEVIWCAKGCDPSIGACRSEV